MYRNILRILSVPVILSFFISTILVPVANAHVIDTQHILSSEQTTSYTEIESFLARADVQKQMINMGVDPENAKARVAALNDQELKLLQQQINDLPAGSGALALIGAVFLVLLILELVGVTHVFTNI
jgi:hypothetical protein